MRRKVSFRFSYFLKCEQPTMVPDTSFALNTFCICERADTCVCAETLPPVTHPSFTEITDCTLQLQKDIILGLLWYRDRNSSSITLNVSKYPFSQWVHFSWAREYELHLYSYQAAPQFILFDTHFCRSKYNAQYLVFSFSVFHISYLMHENCVFQLKPEIHKW